MSDLKSKINEIKKRETDWDKSALEIFAEWERTLAKLELDKNYLNLPQSIVIAKDLGDKINNIREILLTKKEMSQEERNSLFNLKEIAEMLYAHYSIEENQKQFSSLERDINNNI